MGWLWKSPGLVSDLLDLVGEFRDLVENNPSLGEEVTNLSVGVHHSGVISAAEKLTYLRQREVCHLST